jgi:hypothetical protein
MSQKIDFLSTPDPALFQPYIDEMNSVTAESSSWATKLPTENFYKIHSTPIIINKRETAIDIQFNLDYQLTPEFIKAVSKRKANKLDVDIFDTNPAAICGSLQLFQATIPDNQRQEFATFLRRAADFVESDAINIFDPHSLSHFSHSPDSQDSHDSHSNNNNPNKNNKSNNSKSIPQTVIRRSHASNRDHSYLPKH